MEDKSSKNKSHSPEPSGAPDTKKNSVINEPKEGDFRNVDSDEKMDDDKVQQEDVLVREDTATGENLKPGNS